LPRIAFKVASSLVRLASSAKQAGLLRHAALSESHDASMHGMTSFSNLSVIAFVPEAVLTSFRNPSATLIVLLAEAEKPALSSYPHWLRRTHSNKFRDVES
jgi:hypothetical protein